MATFVGRSGNPTLLDRMQLVYFKHHQQGKLNLRKVKACFPLMKCNQYMFFKYWLTVLSEELVYVLAYLFFSWAEPCNFLRKNVKALTSNNVWGLTKTSWKCLCTFNIHAWIKVDLNPIYHLSIVDFGCTRLTIKGMLSYIWFLYLIYLPIFVDRNLNIWGLVKRHQDCCYGNRDTVCRLKLLGKDWSWTLLHMKL